MARKPTQAQVYDDLLTRYGLEVADAFERAVADIATAAELQRLAAAIETGNLEAVVAALNLEQAAYSPLLEAIRTAYAASGATAASYFPARLVARFDVRNPRAERWLAEQSSRLVREIIADQRVALRQALTAGMERGAGPKTVALEIVGRVNKATGQREGGILGLTSQQEGYARAARAELESGDPVKLKAYLDRKRRDKRFDRTIRKALADEAPVPAETIRKAEAAYRARLLQLRGQMIGRTESLTALRAAKHETYRQAVDKGQITESAITRIWRDSSDLRVRHSHAVLDGKKVQGLSEPFRSPVTGALMLYPGDRSFGAPASELIGCRCDEEIRLDFFAEVI